MKAYLLAFALSVAALSSAHSEECVNVIRGGSSTSCENLLQGRTTATLEEICRGWNRLTPAQVEELRPSLTTRHRAILSRC